MACFFFVFVFFSCLLGGGGEIHVYKEEALNTFGVFFLPIRSNIKKTVPHQKYWQLFIYLGRSNFLTYFLGFSIHVSNTTSKEDGILYFHDTQCTIDTIPSSFTLSKSVLGRYVTYYNTREGDLSNKEGYSPFAYLDLCEVQVHGKFLFLHAMFYLNCSNLLVSGSQSKYHLKSMLLVHQLIFFLPSTITLTLMVCCVLFFMSWMFYSSNFWLFFPGCPFVGFYGKTCSQRCPVNCQICHMTKGECLGGCTTGFEGDRCEQFTRGAFFTYFLWSISFHISFWMNISNYICIVVLEMDTGVNWLCFAKILVSLIENPKLFFLKMIKIINTKNMINQYSIFWILLYCDRLT